MKVTLYTVPAAGGTPVNIISTQASRSVEIVEDDSGAEQGVYVQYPYDKFTQAFQVAPSRQPILLGNKPALSENQGPILGFPVQRDQSGTVLLRSADIYVKLTSMTATATRVRVTEFD